MLLNLIEALRAWMTTQAGFNAVATVFCLGLLVAFLFLVFAINIHTQYNKLMKEHDECKKNEESLRVTVDGLTSDLQAAQRARGYVEDRLKKSNAELSATLEQTRKELADANRDKTALSQEHRNTVDTLETQLANSGLETAQASNKYLNTLEALMLLKSFILGFIVSNPVTVKTFIGTASSESGLSIDPTAKLHLIEVTDLVAKYPDANIDTVLEYSNAHNPEPLDDSDPEWLFGFSAAVSEIYSKNLDILLNKNSPLFYISVLYIGSLRLKLVMASSCIQDLHESKDVTLLDKVDRNLITSFIASMPIKSRINGDHASILYLNSDLKSVFGGAFDSEKVFNKKFFDHYRPVSS